MDRQIANKGSKVSTMTVIEGSLNNSPEWLKQQFIIGETLRELTLEDIYDATSDWVSIWAQRVEA